MAQIDLVEAAEATAVESAILWRVKTILGALLPAGELDAWLRRVGLAGATGELKSEVERMETVVNGVNGRAVGNKPLARSLARVKELMDDADDVVDELDYFSLQQQQVQGVMTAHLDGMVADGAEQVDASANTSVMLAPATEAEGMVGDGDRDGAEQADASANNTGTLDNRHRKNRSELWNYFQMIPPVNGEPKKSKCNHCGTKVKYNGTAPMRKHLESCNKKRSAIEDTPNHPSAGESVHNGATISTNDSEGRKRMRTENSVATITHLWDKAEFLKRIQEIILELRSIRGYVIEYLKDSIARPDQYQINKSDTQVRTSSSLPEKVYGRVLDKYNIIQAIKDAKSDNITVLPIVGIIGIGKTTLAKLVYNGLHIERKFERIWVWVSTIFDEVRVTREILDVVALVNHKGSRNRESYEGVSNYSKLLEVLKEQMGCLSKKFLLVLDDVTDSIDDSRWKDLLDALGSSCRKGNVIIVTTRNLSIAKRLGTVKPFELGALKDDDLWSLFKAYAFYDNDYQEHLNIEDRICAKLKGNPLAAKSAAEMLRQQPTLDHMKNIIKSGIWESLQLRGGIVTALNNIYYHLPYHLQQCFLVCSIFPNDHRFHTDDMVSMWISLGFVKSIEKGRDNLNALVNLCFFEKVETNVNSSLQQRYVMCGMMHEFARLVSRTEFATIDGLECKEVLPTVRHLSIQTDLVYHIDKCENIVVNVKFEEKLQKFEEKLQSIASSLRRLRTVILVARYDCFFIQLKIQFKTFDTFISNLVNCTHLRYPKLENKGNDESLPISLSKFYHLEILDVGCKAIVHDMSDLISMRHLVLTKGACGAFSPARSASLQTIHLEDCERCPIIPSLESLSCLTKLTLIHMPEVTDLLIPSLEELVLINMPKLDRCRFSSSVRDLNSSLRILEIISCKVLKAFPLFERCDHFEIEPKSWLPSITELTIHECPDLVVSNPLPPSSSFYELSIRNVSTLRTMEGSSNGKLTIEFDIFLSFTKFLDNKMFSFHNLRTITRLEIVCCPFSIPLEAFRQLICLKWLEIVCCSEISTSDVPSVHTHEDMATTNLDALLSLKCLRIVHCKITGGWLSAVLQHVQALEELFLCGSRLPNLTSAPHTLSQENPYRDGEINFQADGRWLLPCSLGTLHINRASLEALQPCFPRDMTRLTVLNVRGISGLKSLRLHSCTALEKLVIEDCRSLDAVEGFQSLRSLRCLEVYSCPILPQCLESLSTQTQGYELCPRLEKLRIDDPSFLTTPFCKHLTSLQCLRLEKKYGSINSAGLTCEQEAALQLLTSLQELRFVSDSKLSNLPEGLHSLLSLKRLAIIYCESISRLPERGLPPSLEELVVWRCCKELTEQCRMLATSKLKVIIDRNYMN